MNPLMMLMGAMGGTGMLGGLMSGFGSANKLSGMANAISPVNPTYTPSPYAQQRLGLAQTLLNARMPGATAMERNIYGNQANQLANVNRNATDGSQALALGSAVQGQTNQAFQGLATQEQQDYYNRAQNLSGAQQGMTQEGDKVYQDQLRNYQEQMSLKNAYMGAGMQNQQTAWNSMANMGISGMGVAALMGRPSTGGAPTYNDPYSGMMGMPSSYGAQNGYMPTWINPMGGLSMVPRT